MTNNNHKTAASIKEIMATVLARDLVDGEWVEVHVEVSKLIRSGRSVRKKLTVSN